MKKSIFFRSWFYFRQGWSVYFAFIFAAINTLIITYYLVIENAPFLKTIFPSFIVYVLILVSVGIPTLIIIGYMHYKKSRAYRSEAEVASESNPYMGRMIANSEMLLQLNLKITQMMIKLSNNEKISKEELDEIINMQAKFQNYNSSRSIGDKKDMSFFKKIDDNL